MWLVWKEEACKGRVMPGKGCSWPVHTWDRCWVCTWTSLRPLAVSAGTGAPVPDSSLVSRGLQRLLVQKQYTWHSYYGSISSLPWGTQLGLQQCHRTPNFKLDSTSLKKSHHKVRWVFLVCQRVLQGATKKVCISRQVLIFHIQGMMSLLFWPLPLKWAVMVLWPLFPNVSLWENTWIRTNNENVPVPSFLVETVYLWNVRLCV